jgi:HEPN domain-containing protein
MQAWASRSGRQRKNKRLSNFKEEKTVMADTEFTAHSYRDAAQEHLGQAHFLHHEARLYYLAHYWAGVAVECILRAHGLLENDEFTGRHDLGNLASRADFFRLARGARRFEYVAKVSEANLRWRSAHRYVTEGQLLAYLHGIGIDRRIKGDRLKYNSQRMYTLAEEIVGLGVLKWKSE